MNYTLITGASRGIGAELARGFAREGNNLLLLGRSREALDTLAQELREQYAVRVEVLVKDLLDPEAAYDVYKKCRDQSWPVRVLVNNAGGGLWGKFEELSHEHQQEIIQLNQQVAIGLCHYFIPQMKEIPYSHILNVAGTAAFQPTPYFSVFAATQSFMLSFSLSLRKELKGDKINVSCLCPGPTDTTFFKEAGFKQIDRNRGALMKPDEVAAIALSGLLEQKALIIPGFSNRLGRWMSRFLPQGWMSALLGNYFRPD